MAIKVEDFLNTNTPQRDLMLMGIEALRQPDVLKDIIGKNACVDVFLLCLASEDNQYLATLESACSTKELKQAVKHAVCTSSLLDKRKEIFGV